MNLGEAVDLGASQFFHAPHGLLGQLLDIARHSPEGQAGRPAAALGVTPATWNAWLAGARGSGGRAPSPANLAKIREASRRARARGVAPPTRATVTAYVEWAGYFNPNAYRTTTLDGLVLGDMAREWSTGADRAAVAGEFLGAVKARYGVVVNFYPDPPRGVTGPAAVSRGVKVTFKA